MVLLVYSSSPGLLVYLTKVLLLYAVAQDQGSFVSRDGETTLNYPGGSQALLQIHYFTIEPLTKEKEGGGGCLLLSFPIPVFSYPILVISHQLVCLPPVGILNNVQFELFVSVVCLAPLALTWARNTAEGK